MAIRAIISVANLQASVDVSASNASFLSAEIQATFNYVALNSTLHYQLANATDIVTLADSKNKWLYEDQIVSDLYDVVLNKVFDDPAGTFTDEVTDRLIGKNLQEPLNAVEQTSFTLELAPFTDTYVVSDNSGWLLTKDYSEVVSPVTDVNNWSFTKNATETLVTAESVVADFSNLYTDTVTSLDQAAIAYPKEFSDVVVPTDDFYGNANSDDDQTAIFGKGRSDSSATSDNAFVGFGLNKTEITITADAWGPTNFSKALSDTPITEELLTEHLTKPLADTFTTADLFAIQRDMAPFTDVVNAFMDGSNFYNDYVDPTYFAGEYVGTESPEIAFYKATTDTATTADSLLPFELDTHYSDVTNFSDLITDITFNKAISDTANATDDFLAEANPDDDQVMALSRTKIDSVGSSDSIDPVLTKVPTSTSSTSDSGSLRMTDYCDVNYFADSYIGTHATF